MKDGKFETQAQIWEYLLKGGKVKIKGVSDSYLFLMDGTVTNKEGFKDVSAFEWPENWSIYEEPKPKKKVTLYRYTYLNTKSELIHESFWFEGSFREYQDNYAFVGDLLKTESKEVEYDDV